MLILTRLQRANFSVPEHFDWNATTGDNYWCPYGQFYGPYAKVRAELDYTVMAKKTLNPTP